MLSLTEIFRELLPISHSICAQPVNTTDLVPLGYVAVPRRGGKMGRLVLYTENNHTLLHVELPRDPRQWVPSQLQGVFDVEITPDQKVYILDTLLFEKKLLTGRDYLSRVEVARYWWWQQHQQPTPINKYTSILISDTQHTPSRYDDGDTIEPIKVGPYTVYIVPTYVVSLQVLMTLESVFLFRLRCQYFAPNTDRRLLAWSCQNHCYIHARITPKLNKRTEPDKTIPIPFRFASGAYSVVCMDNNNSGRSIQVSSITLNEPPIVSTVYELEWQVIRWNWRIIRSVPNWCWQTEEEATCAMQVFNQRSIYTVFTT